MEKLLKALEIVQDNVDQCTELYGEGLAEVALLLKEGIEELGGTVPSESSVTHPAFTEQEQAWINAEKAKDYGNHLVCPEVEILMQRMMFKEFKRPLGDKIR